MILYRVRVVQETRNSADPKSEWESLDRDVISCNYYNKDRIIDLAQVIRSLLFYWV